MIPLLIEKEASIRPSPTWTYCDGPAVPFKFLFPTVSAERETLKTVHTLLIRSQCTTPLQTSNSYRYNEQVTLQWPLRWTQGCIMFIKRDGAWGAECTRVEWRKAENVLTQHFNQAGELKSMTKDRCGKHLKRNLQGKPRKSHTVNHQIWMIKNIFFNCQRSRCLCLVFCS